MYTFINSLRFIICDNGTRNTLILHMYHEKNNSIGFKLTFCLSEKWAYTSFSPLLCYFFLFLVLFSWCYIYIWDISVFAWVSFPLCENSAMFMPSLLMPPHLSLVPCLYPLPCREHSSLSSTTKGQWWRALSLLLVVLKGTPSLSSADGADSFHPAGKTSGAKRRGDKNPDKWRHTR